MLISTTLKLMRRMRDLSLYWSSNGFTIDGIQYEGLPIFLRPRAMTIEYRPTEFCLHVAIVRGRSRSPLTWKAYGLTLHSFIVFMEAQGLNWEDPPPTRIEEWIGHFRSSLERRGLVRGTIARSVRIVCAFYDWLSRKGLVDTPHFTTDLVRHEVNGMFAHVVGAAGIARKRPALLPRVPRRRRYPRFYTRQELEAIYSVLNPRDQLIMEWALYTGARQFEICNLRVDQLPRQSQYRTRRVVALPLIGKGSVAADLYVPAWLMNKTLQFVSYFGRTEIVRAARKRGARTPDNVFLSRWGTRLRPNSVYRSFSATLRKLGLRGTFHDLRHTYAISMLQRIMSLPRHENSDGANALLELKHLMRHASLSSTQVYLEARNFYLTSIYVDLFELPERYRTEETAIDAQ